ncbi:AAA family ATPase [Actinoplanes sp. HUAS TT8]|uniref:AAA family ATPase n=1 Tax=Actinoplanes sp. HUAS TT8 TaxID=3447453 RepID=UPI003F522F7B
MDAGVPVFVAAKNNGDRGPEFLYPKGWETTKPDHRAVNRWRPGWALCAVMGVAADVLDTDPRNGGDKSRAEAMAAGQWPQVFGVASTPSGGTHEIISRTHEAKGDPWPGVDLQAGADNGQGRGFVFIAPTVRVAKAGPRKGQEVAYRWESVPDMDLLAEFDHDPSVEGVVAALSAKRARRTAPAARKAAPATESAEDDPFDVVTSEWTPESADRVIQGQLQVVRNAKEGAVNSALGGAARVLGRFIAGGYLTEDEAAGRLLDALQEGGVHSDRWNLENGLSWSASTLIGKAFAKGAEEPWPVTAASADGPRYGSDTWEIQEAAKEAEARKHTARDRIRGALMKLSELAAMPPARPLIKGVLDFDSESWLIGQSGGFKSFVAVDWACHVAAGTAEWRGRKVTAGDVLYVVAEGARGFAKRVTAWSARHGVSPDRLHILPMPVQARGVSNRDLSEDWLALIEVAAELEPAMVVLDTQARMTVGLEENSATDMGLWVKAVDDLKAATGACILVVHHTGRNGGDARGSSAIDAAQDMEWKVDRKPGELRATLRCDKSKDGDDRQRFAFVMDVIPVGRDEDGDEITSLVLGDEVDTGFVVQQGIAVLETISAEGESLSNQEWILRTLKVSEPTGQGVTQAELGRLVNGARGRAEPALEPMKHNTYKTTLKRLLDGGQVYKRGQRVSATDPAQDATEDADWYGG